MVTDDVFADQVVVDRPPVLVVIAVIAVADRREVVGKSVKPDVGDVSRVPGEWDSPRHAGAADGEIPQPATDQTERLVAAEVGLDRPGVG